MNIVTPKEAVELKAESQTKLLAFCLSDLTKELNNFLKRNVEGGLFHGFSEPMNEVLFLQVMGLLISSTKNSGWNCRTISTKYSSRWQCLMEVSKKPITKRFFRDKWLSFLFKIGRL